MQVRQQTIDWTTLSEPRERPAGFEAREWRVRGERGESKKVERRGPLSGSVSLHVMVGRSNSNVSLVARPADQIIELMSQENLTCCRRAVDSD